MEGLLNNLNIADSASNIFQKRNILILEDSEHSFLVLGKDIMKSLRGSSPDEGVSDCDYSDEQSVFSSVSHCHSSDTEYKPYKSLENNFQEKHEGNNIALKEHQLDKKLTTFQEEVASAVHQMSENRDLLRSVKGSIDDIDRAMDYVERSFTLDALSPIASTRTWDSSSLLESPKRAKMIQTPRTEIQSVSEETESIIATVENQKTDAETRQAAVSDETEKLLVETNKAQPGFIEDSSKLQDHSQKTNTSDIDPRDLEIMQLKMMNETLKEQIERLEENDFVMSTTPTDQSLEHFLPSISLTDNLNAYKVSLQKLNNCFTSMYSRYTEAQNIILECANIINGIECLKFKEDSSLTEKDFAEYKKTLINYRTNLTCEKIQIMDDKQKMVNAEQQFHKILSDHSFLVRKLDTVTLENEKIKTYATLLEEEKRQKEAEMKYNLDVMNKILSEERAALIQQQQSFQREKDVIHAKLEEIMVEIQTLEQQRETLAGERKTLKGEVKTLKTLVDRQEQLHGVEKSTLEKEVLLLRKNCSKLVAENDDLHSELHAKKYLSKERESLKEFKKVLNDELKSRQEKYEALIKENTLLKTKFNIKQVDLNNYKVELAEAHKMIAQLQRQNADL